MRTTVTIEDALYEEAKVQAVRIHRTVGSVIEEALRMYLASASAASTTSLTDLPTATSGGTLPGIDLDSMSTVYAQLDERLSIDEVR